MVAGVALAAGLAGCSSGTAAPGTPAAGTDAAAVEAAFRGHNQALLSRDFATACSFNAPETNQQLVEQASAGGGRVSSCEEALKKAYSNPRAVAVFDGVGKGAKVQGVQVHGDTASITWSVQPPGKKPVTNTSQMRRVNGQWRLVPNGTP